MPKAPIVIHKGLHGHKGQPGRGGVRLVPIPAAARQHRQGSLAERMAAMKAAQAHRPADTGQDGPMLL
ncbi:MAG: hypothetical protein ACOYOU_05760 [Kiritimatiellia bacterium]